MMDIEISEFKTFLNTHTHTKVKKNYIPIKNGNFSK